MALGTEMILQCSLEKENFFQVPCKKKSSAREPVVWFTPFGYKLALMQLTNLLLSRRESSITGSRLTLSLWELQTVSQMKISNATSNNK